MATHSTQSSQHMAQEPETSTFIKRNPSTGKPIQTYVNASAANVNQAVARAHEAQGIWGKTSLAFRQKVFHDVADAFMDEADSLAQSIGLETGKPLHDAITADVNPAVMISRYYANNGPRILREKPLPFNMSCLTGRWHKERRVPRGVVAVISPWNYPVAIPVSAMAAALMSGNSVILKPSEHTPACGQAIVRVFQKVFEHHRLPEDCTQTLLGQGFVGEHLINSAIDYGLFTGSTGAGNRIRQQLTERGIPFSLELGGSCPMIVLDSVQDLDAVASHVLWSRFLNAGQACASTKRLFVPARLHDEMVSRLIQKMACLRMGAPEETGCHFGPLISQQQRDILDNQVRDAIQHGATLEMGGVIPDQDGWFYPPTLLTKVPPDTRILNEETFGPVLPVISYKNVDSAVAIANDSIYGLTASVYGEPETAKKIARQLQAGLVAVNDPGLVHYGFPAIPWHGLKQSGAGTSHGLQPLLDMTIPQVVAENSWFFIPFFRKPPWFFHSAPGPEPMAFSKAMLNNFGKNRLLHKHPVAFLWTWLQNRPRTKL